MAIVVDRIGSGPPYASNSYLLRAGPESDTAALVDPGTDTMALLKALADSGARLEGILVTHGDVDHVASVAEVAARTGAEVYASKEEAEALRCGLTRTGSPIAVHEPEHLLSGGERFELAGIAFEAVSVPGHSAADLAFCAEGCVFTGDLLFAGSVGRSDLPGGSHAELVASVSRLFELVGPDPLVYPGHGEPTTLGHELETNPFLRALGPR